MNANNYINPKSLQKDNRPAQTSGCYGHSTTNNWKLFMKISNKFQNPRWIQKYSQNANLRVLLKINITPKRPFQSVCYTTVQCIIKETNRNNDKTSVDKHNSIGKWKQNRPSLQAKVRCTQATHRYTTTTTLKKHRSSIQYDKLPSFDFITCTANGIINTWKIKIKIK